MRSPRRATKADAAVPSLTATVRLCAASSSLTTTARLRQRQCPAPRSPALDRRGLPLLAERLCVHAHLASSHPPGHAARVEEKTWHLVVPYGIAIVGLVILMSTMHRGARYFVRQDCRLELTRAGLLPARAKLLRLRHPVRGSRRTSLTSQRLARCVDSISPTVSTSCRDRVHRASGAQCPR